MTQDIQLKPGWNSVFVQVEPEDRNLENLLDGIPVKSVWAWNKRVDSVQYLTDPEDLLPENPEWLHWEEPDSPSSFTNNLHIIRGGKAYLIHLGGVRNVTWRVTGIPNLNEIEWIPDSFNLVGFNLNPSAPPRFGSFFALSNAHAGQPIYRLNDRSKWVQVSNPTTAPMRNGEAFWIFTDGPSTFQGPLAVGSPSGPSLDFGRLINTLDLRIKNNDVIQKSVNLNLLPSEDPPTDQVSDLAGDVVLDYFGAIIPGGSRTWMDFPGNLPLTLAPGEVAQLRVQVRRSEFAPYSGGSDSFLYQNLLEVTDGGTRILVPITSEGLEGDGVATIAKNRHSLKERSLRKVLNKTAKGLAPQSTNSYAGLWVGTVALDSVNIPADASDPNTPRPTERDYQFRIIVHVDANGQARLLQQVFLMFTEGTLIDDPNDPSIPPSKIVDEPGQYRLITDEALLDQVSGSILRDGKTVGRRFSSTAFPFIDPIDIESSGDFGVASTVSSVTIVLDYDDPLNPFKHKYHPDHDNLDRRFENQLGPGNESFTIIRGIEMEFTEDDPDGFASVGLGDTLLVGFYRETIDGLHRDDLHVSGTFRLKKMSSVDTLNQVN
ncbi:MAG: hypothetical protein KC944_06600 [Candidatus Omnitrophica bacterium]|nr:hypothetical protein [Candidatus Omnitrophota bacterium]